MCHRATVPALTVMESDLSSSDAALRMLFVEDVELLERGIFRLRSFLFLSKCPCEREEMVCLWCPLDFSGFAV